MSIPNPSISIKVIVEDEFIIIIDKPAGIPCLPIKGDEKETLANGLAAKWPAAEIVHRLDNDTSGCLLAAKDQAVYEALRKQFDENKIFKQYTALVLGETPTGGVIETPIVHDPRDKKKMKTVPLTPKGRGSQTAYTTFKLLKKYLAGQYSLLEVTIKTGVRHQIRVHLASLGHPIAGDKLYQNLRQRARDRTGLARQFLHASRIGFTHPGTGKWVEFESPPPKELRNVLTKLDRIL